MFRLSVPFFQNSFFTTYGTKRLEPQNSLKSQTSANTHHQNAPTVKTCKKTLSGRGQNPKVNDRYTLLIFFSEAQGSQKGVKMDAKMEPQGIENHEKNITKTTLPKVSYWVHFGSKMGLLFRGRRVPKITKILERLKMGPGPPK